MLWVRISIRVRCTTLCDKVCQVGGFLRFPQILLKVALNTIKSNHHMSTFKVKVDLRFKQTVINLKVQKIYAWENNKHLFLNYISLEHCGWSTHILEWYNWDTSSCPPTLFLYYSIKQKLLKLNFKSDFDHILLCLLL